MENINPDLKEVLSKLPAEQGDLVTLGVHKVGVFRGAGAERKVYGDDTTLVLLWTGFEYADLIHRSKRILDRLVNQGHLIEGLAKETLREHPGATLADACAAVQETYEWFSHVSDQTPQGTTWKPLEVEGRRIKGCKTYVGPDNTIPDGTIYVQGLKLSEKVVVPAPNGPWVAQSKAKTRAKEILHARLPVGRFCQYRLEKERLQGLAVGAQAAEWAVSENMRVDPSLLPLLFSVGP